VESEEQWANYIQRSISGSSASMDAFLFIERKNEDKNNLAKKEDKKVKEVLNENNNPEEEKEDFAVKDKKKETKKTQLQRKENDLTKVFELDLVPNVEEFECTVNFLIFLLHFVHSF